MGAWLLFQLTLKFFSFLAWPCVALVYPLCASIRAIETKSKYQTEKLVTYWILFSIISLFEHAFFNQLQRIPVWFFTRLAFVCWLVIPSFNGSVSVYKHFVQPCLSFDLQDAIDWFLHQTHSLRRRDHFLDKVDQYINDNGTEALEKLLARKQTSKMPKPCFVAEGAKLAACKDGKLKTTESYLVSEESNGAEEDSAVIKYEHGFMPPDIKVLNVTEKLEATEAKQKHVNTYTWKGMFEINETTTSVEVCGLDPLCLKLMSKIPSIVSDGAKLHAFDDGKPSLLMQIKYEHDFLPSGIKVLNVTEKMEPTKAKQKQVNSYTRKRMFEINETTTSVEVCGLDPLCLQLMSKIPSIVSDGAKLHAFDDGMRKYEHGFLPSGIKVLNVTEKMEATEAKQKQVNAYTRKRMFEINETTASVEVCGLDPFCLQLMRKIPSIVSDGAELRAFDDGELKTAKSCLVSEKSKAAVEGSDVCAKLQRQSAVHKAAARNCSAQNCNTKLQRKNCSANLQCTKLLSETAARKTAACKTAAPICSAQSCCAKLQRANYNTNCSAQTC
ncbi:hypothetical protein ACFE04_023382 [Oxalis oulophora]